MYNTINICKIDIVFVFYIRYRIIDILDRVGGIDFRVNLFQSSLEIYLDSIHSIDIYIQGHSVRTFSVRGL